MERRYSPVSRDMPVSEVVFPSRATESWEVAPGGLCRTPKAVIGSLPRPAPPVQLATAGGGSSLVPECPPCTFASPLISESFGEWGSGDMCSSPAGVRGLLEGGDASGVVGSPSLPASLLLASANSAYTKLRAGGEARCLREAPLGIPSASSSLPAGPEESAALLGGAAERQQGAQGGGGGPPSGGGGGSAGAVRLGMGMSAACALSYEGFDGFSPVLPGVEASSMWGAAAGPQALRRHAALDLHAPPGYEALGFGGGAGGGGALEARVAAAEQEALLQDLTAHQRVVGRAGEEGSGTAAGGACGGGGGTLLYEQQQQQLQQQDTAPCGNFDGRRPSIALAAVAQVAREKMRVRKPRSQRGPLGLGAAASSLESAPNMPVMGFASEVLVGGGGQGGGGAGVACPAPLPPIPSENDVDGDRRERLVSISSGLQKLHEEAAAFVSLLYDAIFDERPVWRVPFSVGGGRGLPRPQLQLADLAVRVHSPRCSRRQLLDPQLLGSRTPQDQPVFDAGTGPGDVLRQLTALKSCLGGFALTVESLQVCVAGVDRVSCSVRGALMIGQGGSRCPDDNCVAGGGGSQREEGGGRSMPASVTAVAGSGGGSSVQEGIQKVGRFSHFLTLRPRPPPAAETAGSLGESGEAGGKRVGGVDACHPVSSGSAAMCSPFIIESEVFVALTASESGGIPLSAQVCGVTSLLQELDFGNRGIKAFDAGFGAGNLAPAPLSAQAGLRSIVGRLHGGLPGSPEQQSRSVLGRLPAMFKSEMAMAAGRGVGLSGQLREGVPDCGDALSRGPADCPEDAVSQLVSSLRVDGGLAAAVQTEKGLMGVPGVQGVSPEAFERTVFVSWIPRAARAHTLSGKEAAEEKLKTVLTGDLGICGIERVLVFPPRGLCRSPPLLEDLLMLTSEAEVLSPHFTHPRVDDLVFVSFL
ncbi:hypothetical protein cyc_00583 [Cyclospora cayetanensis]|uniref:Uncharacterized protein n=1 Tax=Cyclospora cayetanensis TaxID=88456 RepID=A0A1D3CYP4_9EIME|nr:hypothetical protein cyc_00583 [Cyclospora cayetanensis]